MKATSYALPSDTVALARAKELKHNASIVSDFNSSFFFNDPKWLKKILTISILHALHLIIDINIFETLIFLPFLFEMWYVSVYNDFLIIKIMIFLW